MSCRNRSGAHQIGCGHPTAQIKGERHDSTKSTRGKKTQPVSEEQKLTQLVEEIIDRGANTAEEINRAVLDLPVTILERLGLEEAADGVKKVQDSSIGAIYNLIRDINHKVADMATDLLKQPGGH